MRILWITSLMMPKMYDLLGRPRVSTGGWLNSSLTCLKDDSTKDLEIGVASVYNGNKYIKKEIDGVTYYLLPLKRKSGFKYQKSLEPYWNAINNDYKPNVIHIHGSEFPYGLSWVNACGNKGVVISIQGLVSVIAKYYLAGIVKNKLNPTIRDIIKHESVKWQQKNFYNRGILETTLIKSVKYVIGRTEWDKSHVWAVNPNAEYFYCGETLRTEFYKHKWKYDDCIPYSIFVSQGGYPIKGLHKIIEALPLVLRFYPQTVLYVAGSDIVNKSWFRITDYGKYIEGLIRKYHLHDKVVFTGSLNEKDMCQRFLNSNVFVCPSAIENSPNSLGEAQILGVPYVSSFVGGIPEITNMSEKALYRYEETEMLAKKICDIFKLKNNYIPDPFDNGRYDGLKNNSILIDIYKTISSK